MNFISYDIVYFIYVRLMQYLNIINMLIVYIIREILIVDIIIWYVVYVHILKIDIL